MKKYWWGCGALAAAVLIAYGYKGKSAAVAVVPQVQVDVIKAQIMKLPYKYNTVGTAVPLQEVEVRPQISGKLTDILFEEGSMVAEGDVIARIDDASPEAELDKSEAELAVNLAKLHEAEANFVRYQKLHKNAIVSQKTLEEYESMREQLRAAVSSNRAQVEIAAVNLKHTKITAPISGRIGLKNINKGNIVSAGGSDVIATIVQISPISVVFSVPQQLFPALKQNQETIVEVNDSSSNLKLGEGKLAAFDNAIDSQNGTIKIRANIDNADGALWPGQSVSINLIYGYNQTGVVLPNKSVRPGLNGNYVYVYSEGMAKIVPVSIGYQDDNNTVIESGVKEGDLIITGGFSKLSDGMKVDAAQQPEEGGNAA